MFYRDALALSDECAGVIRCTYADLYDKDGTKLYSLQSRAASYFEPRRDLIDEKGVEYGYPVVMAHDYSDKELVPAFLTDFAAEKLAEYANNKNQCTRYTVIRIWKKDSSKEGYDDHKAGERQVVKTCYHMTSSEAANWTSANNEYYEHEIKKERVAIPAVERLTQIIANCESLYIKPAAFTWYPLGVEMSVISAEERERMEAEIASLDEQIAAAKKEMDNAKNILIAAGAVSFL